MKNYIHQCPVLTPANIHMTTHATDRALDMALSTAQIRTVLFAPTFGYFSRKHDAWAISAGWRDGGGAGIA